MDWADVSSATKTLRKVIGDNDLDVLLLIAQAQTPARLLSSPARVARSQKIEAVLGEKNIATSMDCSAMALVVAAEKP